MEIIGQPTDFLGLNIYSGTFVREGRDGHPDALPFPPIIPAPPAPG